MARPKKQLNRRFDIINTAERLFTEKGFEKTTITEIANCIGIGKGSVYLDFKNKDEIYQSIIEQNSNELLEKLEFQIKNTKDSYLKLLKDKLSSHPLFVFDRVTSQIHTREAMERTSYMIRYALDHTKQRGTDTIASLLKLASENNEIKKFDDYRYLAYLIVVGMYSFYPPYDPKYCPYNRTDLSKEKIRDLLGEDVSFFLEILLSGIRKQ